MKHDFSGFDRDMRRSQRNFKRGFAAVVIIRLAIIGLLIFGGVKLIQHLSENDTSLVKEFGKSFEGIKEEFNEGRQEVTSDTLVVDTLNVK
jgi:hypothetical protein